MIEKRKTRFSFLSLSRLACILLLSLLLTLPAMAEDNGEATEEIPLGDGEIEVVIEASENAEEDIILETGSVTGLTQSEEDMTSALQTEVDEGIRDAQDGEAYIELQEQSYEIGTLLLKGSSTVQYIEISGQEGGTTIKGNLDVQGVIVNLINIILGGDKTVVELENKNGKTAILEGAVLDEGTDAEVLIIQDQELESYEESHVELQVSPGAEVVADLEVGSLDVTVPDDELDPSTVKLSGRNSVGFRYRPSYAPSVTVQSKGSGLGTVNLMETTAESVDMVIRAAKVNLRGETEVNSLKIIASSEDSAFYDPDLGILEDIPGVSGYVKNLNIRNVVDAAVVNILGNITAKDDITVYSYVTQSGVMIGGVPVNLGINVKIGTAEINVAKGVSISSEKNVTLKSTVRADAGYDENGNAQIGVLPLAVNVFINSAAVTLEDGVTISANGNILADAMSTIKTSARCQMGAAPVSLAVNVILNDSATTLGSNVRLTAGGDISLLSAAVTDASALAERKSSATGLNGVYLATNVVIQNSDTVVAEQDNLTAGGDMTISSTSDVNATDDAISSATSTVESGEKSQSVKQLLTGTLKTLLNKVTKSFTNSDLFKSLKNNLVGALSKKVLTPVKQFFTTNGSYLDKAIKLLGASGYSVTLDKDAQSKGSVKTTLDDSEIRIRVESDYKVEQILVRYLLSVTAKSAVNPESRYTFTPAVYDKDSGSYVLKLADLMKEYPIVNPEFRVYVFYGEMNDSVELKELSDEGDDDFNLGDFFDSALESASDENEADDDLSGGTIPLNYIFKFNGDPSDNKGIVITDVMAADVTRGISALSGLTHVPAGKNVRLNVNPAENCKLILMKASYTNTNGEPNTIDINQNAAGHYILTVPSDVREGATITITADFTEDNGTTRSNAETPSSFQFTGALGVGVVINRNNATVDAGEGRLSAAGKLNLIADATTNVSSTGNGTAVGADDVTKAKNAVNSTTEESMAKTVFDLEKDDKLLTVIGMMKDEKSCGITKSGTVYTITLNAAASYGYSLPASIALNVLGEDNRMHTIAVSGKDGVYTADLSRLDLSTDSFGSESHELPTIRSLRFVATYALRSYKLSLDVVTHKVSDTAPLETYGKAVVNRSTVTALCEIIVTTTPKDGYEASDIYLSYKLYKDADKKDPNDVEEKQILATALGDNRYGITLLEADEFTNAVADSFRVSVNFRTKQGGEEPKTVSCQVKSDIATGNCISVEKNPKVGAEVKLALTDAYRKTCRINGDNIEIHYTNTKGEDKTIEFDSDALSFTVPSDVGEGESIVIGIKDYGKGLITEMHVRVVVENVENNPITAATETTCAGDTLRVTVLTEKGHAVKSGSVKATFVKDSKTIFVGTAVLVATNVYEFTIPEGVGNDGGTVTVSAKFELADQQTTSLGIGTSVNVIIHRNNARVLSGRLSAAELNISADTVGKAEAKALSGYSATTTGLAGAVAVQVAGYKTNAILSRGVEFIASSLSVNARSAISSFNTGADATGKKVAGVTGVGTGVAVAVNGVDTFATVEDGVIDSAYGELKSIHVNAANSIKSDSITAKAGSKTKKAAVSPVVALNICGSCAESYLGKALSGGSEHAYNADTVTVSASNSVAHTMTVDAGSTVEDMQGTVTLLAGAFGINILNDAAEAVLSGSVKSSDAIVKVDAQSVSTLSANVKSSASGASKGKKDDSKGKGSADAKADALIKSGEKLAAGTGTQSTAPTTLSRKTENRQNAQTSEGSIAGAAAFALNIQSNTATAEVAESVSILGDTAEQSAASLEVLSRTRTDADLTADGSATLKKSASAGKDAGIGVAVAINIVSNTNNALVSGGSSIRADKVCVEAGMTKNDKGEDVAHSVNTSSISGAGASGVSVAGSVALAVLHNHVEAKVEKGLVFSANSTTVKASDIRSAETTASASATAAGKADKNASKTDASKAADADAAKTVGVGASFAMIYGENDVLATLMLPSQANVGELKLYAFSDHSEESTSVAGSDPISSFASSAKLDDKAADISVDASAAVNAIETVVRAALCVESGSAAPTVNAKTVRISAKEKGKSRTDASGYAMGSSTAVGAAVAVNLNCSVVESINQCVLKVSGDDTDDDEDPHQRKSVDIYASGEATEENMAYATAIGADLLRYVAKYKAALSKLGTEYEKMVRSIEELKADAEALAKLAKEFLDGTLFDKILNSIASGAISTAKSTVNSKIANLFNKKQPNAGSKANASMPISVNILRVFGVGTQSTDALDKLSSQANKETNAAVNGSDPKSDKTVAEALKDAGAKGNVKTTEASDNAKLDKKSESFQMAAAVAVSVSSHDILAENAAEIVTAGGASVSAESSVDAIAHATGAALSAAGGTGSIAMAVAVKVDSTSTVSRVSGSITVGADRDISLLADAKENTGDAYADTLGIQAVAGAASGEAKLAISGAVAVFASSANTVAELCENCSLMAKDSGYANSVTIEATEIARQTLRTVAASASEGTVTVGASVGTFITKNNLKASVGKNARIKANTIRVKAERRSVSVNVDTGEISAETEEESSGDGETTTTGVSIKGLIRNQNIITIKTKDATTTTPQTTTVNVDVKSLLSRLEQALNALSHVDYYIAVDSGSAAASGEREGVTAVAGSVAVVVIENTVQALVGEGAVLESKENCSVEADSAEQSRVIGGAVTVDLGSKSAVGAVVAFLSEKNRISARVEDQARLSCGGLLNIHAENTGLSELYTVSAVAAGQKADAAVAATINVLLSEAEAEVKLGAGALHTAARAVVEAINSKSLTLVTVSPTVGSGKVQVGGAVTVLVENSAALSDLRGAKLNLSGMKNGNGTTALSVLADNTHNMTVATASASVGKSEAGIAGVISTIVDDSAASVLASGCEILSAALSDTQADRYNAGDVSLAAKNSSKLLQVNVECVAGSQTAAVGASFVVSVLRRSVRTDVENAKIIVGNGSLSILAAGEDLQTIVGAGAGITTGMSVQGNVVVVVENNSVSVNARCADLVTVRGDNISNNDLTLTSSYTSRIYGIAGTLNIAGGSAAAGATVVVLLNNSTTELDLDDALVNCVANVNLCAKADNRLLLVAVGVGGSSGAAIQASVVTAVNSDTVRVNLGKASVFCYQLNIDALGESNEVLVSGSATVGGTAAVGPALLVFVKNRSVEIRSRSGGTVGSVDYGCAIAANALAKDKTLAIVIAAGGGNAAVELGACVEVIKNNVQCDFDAEAYAGNQTVSFRSDSRGELSTYVVGAGFGASAAVVPVITVLYQSSNTLTDVSGRIHGNNLDVLADSSLKLDVVGAGAAVGGSAGISGTFAVVVNKAVTEALFSGSMDGNAETSALNVLANDALDFGSSLYSLAGGGVAGVAVTAAVTVIRNTVRAAIESGSNAAEQSSIEARSVNVSAESRRTVDNQMGTAGIGGEAGVALNVNVLVAGSALPQDAYDSIVYGNGTDSAKTFDTEALILSFNTFNPYLSNHNILDDVSLSADIVGNGQRDSEAGLGDSEGVNTDGILPADLDSDEDDFEQSSSDEKVSEKQTTRGENDNIVPGADSELTKGADLGGQINYSYDADIENCIEARIDRSVLKSESVTVSALDVQNVAMDSLSLELAGIGGGGAGVSVVVLHSNVLASIGSNAEITADEVDVNAASRGDEITVRGGVFGGGGLGSGAVAVAVVHLDSVTAARMDGISRENSTYAGNTSASISAQSAYSKVDASTAAVSVAGLGAVSASVAVVTLNGEVDALVSGTISSINDVNIYNLLSNSIAAHAANVAAGAVGVNAGVAVASETLTLRAALEKGAVVEGAANVRIMNVGAFDRSKNTSESGRVSVFAENVAVSIGLANVAASVAVSSLKPTVSAELRGTVTKANQNLEVLVLNRLDTDTASDVSSAAVTGLAVGANVILSYNNSSVKALVSGDVKADALTIASYLSAESDASMTGLSTALGALGVSVAYAELKADNRALLEGDGKIEVGKLFVFAGGVAANDTKGGNFTAEASLVSGSAGAATAALNLALAVNEAVNMACVKHTAPMTVGALVIKAFGNPDAKAETEAFAASLANVSAAAAAATLNFTQSVIVECSDMTAGADSYTDIDAGSCFYEEDTQRGLTREDSHAYAALDVCAASLVNIKANVAYAKNHAQSLVKITLGRLAGSLQTENRGAANSRSEIRSSDGPIELVAAGANVALSYAQAEFLTEVNCPGIKGEKLSMKTDAKTDALADAVSNGAGVEAGSVEANVVIAKSTGTVKTLITGTDATLDVKSAEISNVAESHTQALLDKAPVTASLITLGGNVVESILATESSAEMSGFRLVGAPALSVSSSLNADPARVVDSDADALARYNGNGPDDNGSTISAIDGKVTVVIAKNYAKNTAQLTDISGQASRTELTAASHATALADCGSGKSSDSFSASLMGVGVIVADSVVDSRNCAIADNYTAASSALDVEAKMSKANAKSVGGVSSLGGISAYAVDVNYSMAVNKAVNEAAVKNSGKAGSPVAVDALTVLADADEVFASAFVGTARVSAAAKSVFSAQADAENLYSGNALVENCFLTGQGQLRVDSRENQNYYKDGTEYVTDATVGASGSDDAKVTLTIEGSSTNKATARSAAEVRSLVDSSTLNGYDLAIQATGRSDVNASAVTGTTVALLNVRVTETEALADGIVEAIYRPNAESTTLNSMDITADGAARSHATTATSGSNVAAASANINSANADSSLQVNAALEGGEIHVLKNAVVEGIGTAQVDARALTPNFSLGGLSVAANEATAHSGLSISTNLSPASLTVDGTLEARALVPTDKVRYEVPGSNSVMYDESLTSATVQPSGGADSTATTVNLIGSTTHTAIAKSEHELLVNLGSGSNSSITAGRLLAESVGNGSTASTADNHGTNIGLFTIGNLYSEARTTDESTVLMGGSLVTTGDMKVESRNDSSNVDATGMDPGKLTALDVSSSEVRAIVDKNLACIEIEDDAQVESTEGGIALRAYNVGHGESSMSAGKGYSLGAVNCSSIPVTQEYDTHIRFGRNSDVRSKKDLEVSTSSAADGKSSVDQSSTSLIFNIATMYGDSEIIDRSTIEVADNAKLTADTGALALNILQGCDNVAVTRYDSTGFIGVGTVQANASYRGENNLVIGSNASLRAENGKLNVTQDSSNVRLNTIASCDNSSFAGDQDVSADSNAEEKIRLNLGSGSELYSGADMKLEQNSGTASESSQADLRLSTILADGAATATSSLSSDETMDLSAGTISAKTIRLAQQITKLSLRPSSSANKYASSIANATQSGMHVVNVGAVNNAPNEGDRVYIASNDAGTSALSSNGGSTTRSTLRVGLYCNDPKTNGLVDRRFVSTYAKLNTSEVAFNGDGNNEIRESYSPGDFRKNGAPQNTDPESRNTDTRTPQEILRELLERLQGESLLSRSISTAISKLVDNILGANLGDELFPEDIAAAYVDQLSASWLKMLFDGSDGLLILRIAPPEDINHLDTEAVVLRVVSVSNDNGVITMALLGADGEPMHYFIVLDLNNDTVDLYRMEDGVRTEASAIFMRSGGHNTLMIYDEKELSRGIWMCYIEKSAIRPSAIIRH